jgi:hypothetical protein
VGNGTRKRHSSTVQLDADGCRYGTLDQQQHSDAGRPRDASRPGRRFVDSALASRGSSRWGWWRRSGRAGCARAGRLVQAG